ncbi:MAG: nitrite reductase, copper-containing [Nitrospina sp.]|nr:nitrite reductase, copper-containing [Nitrospina sp.]
MFTLKKQAGWMFGVLWGLGVFAVNAFAGGGPIATAPHVPDPVGKRPAKTVAIHFEAKEFTGPIADDVTYDFWSFNGTVPGPIARVRAGDTVEFHLSNHKDNSQPHNIDIHAVNGPGGGAAVNTAKPGEEKVFTWKALAPGLYVYHCAAGAIVDHISNGMYGLILVEPEGGLPKVDREYYVFESEFFAEVNGGKAEFSLQKGLEEHPEYVVFNGRQGALMGDNVLKASVGETVRIFFGNIGPNGISSFHIIGEIFDKVYVEGAIGGTVNRNVQTTVVPSAGAAIVEFKVDVPGAYTLVDHSIFRVAKGAIGQLVVEGEEQPKVFRAGK